MKSMIATLKNEPLVHFVIAGLLVFGIDHFWLSDIRTEDTPQEILVTVGDQNRLSEVWRMQWGRLPSDAEMGRLIAAEVRDQILYREALALGLDKKDTIVRRRLVQKLLYLNEDITNLVEPSDADLITYYEQRSGSYAVPSTISFSQIYFSRDSADDPYARAKDLLAQLRTASPIPIRAPERGDGIPNQADWNNVRVDHLDREFGASFGSALVQLPLNSWQGPIESGLGLHLVFLTTRQDSTQPEFSAIKDAVLRDYLFARKQDNAERQYLNIRERYSINIESQTQTQ